MKITKTSGLGSVVLLAMEKLGYPEASTISKKPVPKLGTWICLPGRPNQRYLIDEITGKKQDARGNFEWSAKVRNIGGESGRISSNEGYANYEVYTGPSPKWQVDEIAYEKTRQEGIGKKRQQDAFREKYKIRGSNSSLIMGWALQVDPMPIPDSISLFAGERVRISGVDPVEETVSLTQEETGDVLDNISAAEVAAHSSTIVPSLPLIMVKDQTKYRTADGKEKTAKEIYEGTPDLTKFVFERTLQAAAGTEEQTIQLWARVRDEAKFQSDMAPLGLTRDQYNSRIRYTKMKGQSNVKYFVGLCIRPTENGTKGIVGSGLPPEVYGQLVACRDSMSTANRNLVVRGYGEGDTGVYMHSLPIFKLMISLGISAPAFNPQTQTTVEKAQEQQQEIELD